MIEHAGDGSTGSGRIHHVRVTVRTTAVGLDAIWRPIGGTIDD
jgi:hypothetical protein